MRGDHARMCRGNSPRVPPSAPRACAPCIAPLTHSDAPLPVLSRAQGRIIHIDFGFMLSNTPGGMSFERAPFKLTAEYMAILDSSVDGRPSRCFNYFKVRALACSSGGGGGGVARRVQLLSREAADAENNVPVPPPPASCLHRNVAIGLVALWARALHTDSLCDARVLW